MHLRKQSFSNQIQMHSGVVQFTNKIIKTKHEQTKKGKKKESKVNTLEESENREKKNIKFHVLHRIYRSCVANKFLTTAKIT